MIRVGNVKKNLARVFDDDMRTVQWCNIVDYAIISLIVISTLCVFLSTLDLPRGWQTFLHVVDWLTVIFFTIEVSLRIWVADEFSPKFRGVWGRVRYCLTFYGFVDFVSTYSFYISLFIPLPYSVLRSLRVLRLLRVFRFMRSARLLRDALSSKASEMLVSLQFLVIVTLMMSFVLFFFEHSAQPDVYDDGWVSVLWAFTRYLGDPADYVIDAPPVTTVGRIVVSIIGLLGIAIVAVPAGLVGSGFSEAMDKERHKEELAKNSERLAMAFRRRPDRPTGLLFVPPFLSMSEIMARIGMKSDDIVEVVESSDAFRLVNLADTQTVDERPQDRLAVELAPINTPYGCCIDRGSRVTIVSPASLVDPCVGSFAYYVALLGGFNYVSREVGELLPYRSYETFADRQAHERNLPLYMDDLERLCSRPGAWTLTMLAASGANEPAYPTVFHFSAGGAGGDETFGGAGLVVEDVGAYRLFYEELSASLQTEFGLASDHQRYHDFSSPDLFVRKFSPGMGCRNNVFLRTAWSASLWDVRRMKIAQVIAAAVNRHFDGNAVKAQSPELTTVTSGYGVQA